MNNYTYIKAKYIASIYNGNSIPDEEKDSFTNRSIPYISTKSIDAICQTIDYDNGLSVNKEDGFKIAPKKSTLLCIEGGSAGRKIAFTNCDVAFVNKLCCFHSAKENNKFIFYALQSADFLSQFYLNLNGMIGGVNIGLLKNLFLSRPSLTIQNRIVEILDDKIGKIDALIANENKQIEKLKEYKQAVITEAVTKGLNKNVSMKDSGIEWIGEIPETYKTKKIKYVVDIVRGGSPRPIENYISNNGEGYNWIKIGDTEKGNRYINHTKQKIVKDGLSKTRLVHKNDLILTNSMSFGEPYILNIDGCIHDGWLAFSNYKDIDKTFLYYCLQSNLCMKQFEESVAGGIVQNLNIDKVKDAEIFIPSVKEQTEIIYYLDGKMREVNELISIKQRKKEQLDEYKKSLIYEYVTGKKEVY